MKKSILSAIFVAIVVAISSLCANAQTFSADAQRTYKPSKEVKKVAKKYEKEGWKVSFGAMPMAEQLQRANLFRREIDDENNPKYAIDEGKAVAQYHDAARMQALATARINVLQQLQTDIKTEIANVVGNSLGEDVTSLVETTLASKSASSGVLKNSIVATEIYRELPNGNVEVYVSVAVERQSAKKAAKKAVRDEMRKRGMEIVDQLDVEE